MPLAYLGCSPGTFGTQLLRPANVKQKEAQCFCRGRFGEASDVQKCVSMD
jgi:hypothetical protein